MTVMDPISLVRQEFFEYFDTDGSGLMDLDEFCVMIVRQEGNRGMEGR